MNKNSEIKLVGNKHMPRIGYGTWLLKGNDATIGAQAALDNGYIHIDTAQIYNNEYEIGQILKNYDRSKFFVTSKVWMANFEKYTRQSILESIKRLNVEYIDLMLLHWPYTTDFNVNINAFKELIKAQKDGLVKSIGVSNHTIEHLQSLHKATGVWPAVNQILFTPKNQSNDLVNFCHSKGIVIEGYSLLRVLFALNNDSEFTGKFTDKEQKFIDSLSSKYNKSAPQIIIRWALQRNIVIFPKSRNPERIKANINVFDFELSEKEIQTINAMSTMSIELQVKKLLSLKDIDLDKGLIFDKHY